MSSRPDSCDLEGFMDDSLVNLKDDERETIVRQFVEFYEPHRKSIEYSMRHDYDPETMSWRSWRNARWDSLPNPPDYLLRPFSEMTCPPQPEDTRVPGPETGLADAGDIHGKDGSVYLQRWTAEFRENGDRLIVHRILRSDEDDAFHDHPANFRSLILSGSYREITPDKPPRVYGPGDWNVKLAAEQHRLEVIDGPVITLVWRGPKIREWGFVRGGVWVHNSVFLNKKFGKGNWAPV